VGAQLLAFSRPPGRQLPVQVCLAVISCRYTYSSCSCRRLQHIGTPLTARVASSVCVSACSKPRFVICLFGVTHMHYDLTDTHASLRSARAQSPPGPADYAPENCEAHDSRHHSPPRCTIGRAPRVSLPLCLLFPPFFHSLRLFAGRSQWLRRTRVRPGRWHIGSTRARLRRARRRARWAAGLAQVRVRYTFPPARVRAIHSSLRKI